MLHSKPIIARRPLLLLIGFLAGSAMHLCAEVHISPFFSNNAVLQQKAKVPVWGTAAPSEKVTVAIQGQKASVIADQKGHWLVTLNEMPPGGPFVMTVSGNNTITLNDILVGEVWFCAGQSNMHLPVADAANGKEEVANANHPQIRLFNEMKVGTENLGWPEQDEHAQWQPCSPESVQTFSATAYYFGRELQKTLNVPIGLIHASVGGSKVEGWTSRDTLRTLPEAKSILDGWEKATVNYPKQIEAYRVAYADWKVKEEAARAQGAPIPKAPRRVYGPGAVYEPGGLYERFVAPVIPYGIRGVIWYQGESNRENPPRYQTLFREMIPTWRKAWGEGDFPFLYVQLPQYNSKAPEHPYFDQVPWAEVRDAQLKTLSVPNTAMVVTIDIAGDPVEIHPKNKQEVGARLALAARGTVYREPVVYSGPIYSGMTIDGGTATVTFTHAENGLSTKDGSALVGFAIAGEDRIFVPAEATIIDGKIKVHSDKVTKPVSVRFGWDDTPAVNLFNKEGLPASPFRTDDWPMSITNKS